MPGVSNVIMRLSSVLVCVNSTMNFFLYYVNGSRFRMAWRDTFGCFGMDHVMAAIRSRVARLIICSAQ
jgi:hypothetical protein